MRLGRKWGNWLAGWGFSAYERKALQLFSLLIIIASVARTYQHRTLAQHLALLPAVSDSALAPHVEDLTAQLSLDLNSANASELERLPGIGPAKAGRIVALRDSIRGFDSIGQLDCVEGIGKKTIARLTPFVFVGMKGADSILVEDDSTGR